jgi:hypothetical protein
MITVLGSTPVPAQYLLPITNAEASKKAKSMARVFWAWCGGWDLNPRRPTPSGPEPDPFDQARAPPHLLGVSHLTV